jgi:transcriptional regulator GlxA family with amidase domain
LSLTPSQGVLYQMVRGGTAISTAVATRFGVHERTLRRRLQEQGPSLQQPMALNRFELAQQLLRNTGLCVAAIAAVLGCEDGTAFSRAFRSWSRLSPMQRRERH